MALLTMPFATYAALPETVEPLWDNTNIFTATLSFNGTRGTATVYVDGQSGVTDITLEIKLYYKNTSGSWIEVDKDWNYDVNSSTFAVSETFTGVSGREYKIVVKGTEPKLVMQKPFLRLQRQCANKMKGDRLPYDIVTKPRKGDLR